MPQNDVMRFAAMVAKGFEAVGCRMPVTIEDGAAAVRDIVIEFGPSIECVRASEPDKPFMSFPEGALESAAAAVCMAILSGIVTRAVEAA